MRKYFLLFQVLTLTFLLSVNSAQSNTVPEYDGVYFRISNGNLVQLNKTNMSSHVYVVSSNEECAMWPCVIEGWRTSVNNIREGKLLSITPQRPMEISVEAVFDTKFFWI